MTKLNTRCYYQLTILPCASSKIDMAIFRLVGDVYTVLAQCSTCLFLASMALSVLQQMTSFLDEFH